MKKIRIKLEGGGRTSSFEMRVSPSEYALALEMALASQSAAYLAGMPTMMVEEITDESEQE